ncbi:MAG TPA: MMPL family transporter [Methylomirabilota bacterium]|nr:MMPL family transporter [Methylomirabilota bacterium]
MSDMLGAWGRWVYRLRWWLLAASALSLAPASVILIQGAQLDAGTMLTTTESGRAASLMARQLPGQPVSFELILSSAALRATDRAFREEVDRALAPLKADPRVARVRTPYSVSPPDPAMLSRDGHRARVVVELAVRSSGLVTLGFSSVSPEVYASLRAKVQSRTLEVVGAGMLAINHDFVEVAKRDLKRAELVILPVVVVFLLLAFGSVVAALLPLGVGVLAMIGGIAGTELLARHMSVSAYAPNIVTMIGLGVAIDYSLFIVNRFREEIQQRTVPDALARTMSTTGRAILFSGVTVAIGLLGMLVLGLGNIGSLGLAGTIVVALSVLYGLTFLPAALAILGPRVNALSLPRLGFFGLGGGSGFWHRLAALVMRHPWRFFLPAAALLLLLGQPFLHIRLGAGDVTALPRWAEARRGAELLAREFPGDDETPIIVMLSYRDGSPLSPARVGDVYDLSRWLVKLPGVTAVRSLLDLSPDMSREDYQRFVKIPKAMWPPEMQTAVSRMVGEHIMVLAVSTSHPPGSDEARALVRAIRSSHAPVDGEVLVTGPTAFDLDFLGVVQRNAPFAIALVVVATYAALLILLGSVLLPLKAVIVNLLSISASYGALVWIFQDGHLSRWLDFTPGPIQTATPIIMFCLIFGLSMDYEVLLLSRVREEYERTGDNVLAVGAGLECTGRLITWAGAIMAAVFFAFALADSVIIKAVGVGIGIAVVLDATVVRALLVPATMRLMGTWNWWVPGPVARLARMARPEMGRPAARKVSADGGRGISSRRRP